MGKPKPGSHTNPSCNQVSINLLSLAVKKTNRASTKLDGHCPQPFICPLNKIRAGMAVRIKQLSTSPEVKQRLREMGFCEEQKIKLLSQHSNIICQVCNARLAISAELAENIWVEPLSAKAVAA